MTQPTGADNRPRLLIVANDTLCKPLAKALQDTYRTESVTDLSHMIGQMDRGDIDGVLMDAALWLNAAKNVRNQIVWSEHDVPVILLTDSREPVPFKLIHELNAYHALPCTERSWEYVARSIIDVMEQRDLERENNLLQKVMGAASDCIMAVDEEGTIHLVNGAVVRTFGYARAELMNAKITMLLPREPGRKGGADLHDAIAAGEPWWGEVIAQRRDGSRLPVHVALSFAHDPRGATTYAVIIARDVTELQRLLGRLTQLSIVDDLTDLYNVRYFWARFRYEMIRSRRYKQQLAVLMLDLDHFKKFNDKYGHQAGDKVLHHVAEILKNVTREVDIVARYGGEEFAVILPNTDMGGALTCAENIRMTIANATLDIDGHHLNITLSAGVAWLEKDVKDEDELLRRADSALLQAKQLGRNRVQLWSPDVKQAANIARPPTGE